MRAGTLIALTLTGLQSVSALDRFGILEVVKDFAEDIVAAGRGERPSYDR